ncbi:MAG: dihydrodipicolinate synthase family protein [Tardiphaga sp.]
MVALKGLSAFPITPMDAAGRVDTAALSRLLAPLVEAGVDSIGLLGSTGSYPFLARAERRRAVEVAIDSAGRRVPILVGVGALRTDEAVALAKDARDAGASAGLLAAVSYTPLTDDEVFEHFATVARESRLPICIYDNFATTHFRFTPALVGRLARLDGVIAVKGTSPEPAQAAAHHAALRDAVPAGFSVGYAGDWNVTEMLLAGGEAWYSVAGGLFPKRCLAIVRAAEAGDAGEARRLNAQLQPLWDLFKEFSSLRVTYALAGILDICRAEPPRPILPLPDAATQRIAAVARTLDLS